MDCENCRHLTVVGLHDTGPRCFPGGSVLSFRVSSRSGRHEAQVTGFGRACTTCTGKPTALLVACLTSQQHDSVSQGRICSGKFTCRHTEIEVADPTFYLTQLQYADTGPTSPSADPITPGAWQGSHWSALFFFFSHWYDSSPIKIPPQAGFEPRIFRSRDRRLNPYSPDVAHHINNQLSKLLLRTHSAMECEADESVHWRTF